MFPNPDSIYLEFTFGGKSTNDANKGQVQYYWTDSGNNAGNKYWAPYLTVLVTLNDGVVDSVAWNWEEGSSRCTCGSNTNCHNDLYCGLGESTCTPSSATDEGPCALTVGRVCIGGRC